MGQKPGFNVRKRESARTVSGSYMSGKKMFKEQRPVKAGERVSGTTLREGGEKERAPASTHYIYGRRESKQALLVLT